MRAFDLLASLPRMISSLGARRISRTRGTLHSICVWNNKRGGNADQQNFHCGRDESIDPTSVGRSQMFEQTGAWLEWSLVYCPRSVVTSHKLLFSSRLRRI